MNKKSKKINRTNKIIYKLPILDMNDFPFHKFHKHIICTQKSKQISITDMESIEILFKNKEFKIIQIKLLDNSYIPAIVIYNNDNMRISIIGLKSLIKHLNLMINTVDEIMSTQLEKNKMKKIINLTKFYVMFQPLLLDYE